MCLNCRKPHKGRIAKLNQARATYGFRNVWTGDGKIFFKYEKNPLSKPLSYYN